MTEFIDDHRAWYGVEPICRVLPIAPSTYYEQKAREAQPEREPPRTQHDRWLSAEIQRIWDENFGVYGAKSGANCIETLSQPLAAPLSA